MKFNKQVTNEKKTPKKYKCPRFTFIGNGIKCPRRQRVQIMAGI
jgi:hypothetical protein